MNTLFVAGSMVLIAIIGTLFFKYLDYKEKRNMQHPE
mgnify:CR=1 FL=1